MDRSIRISVVLLFFLTGTMAMLSGCSKKVTPAAVTVPVAPEPAAAPAPPAPSIVLSASPNTIKAGDSSMLSWTAKNAVSVRIEPLIGDVELSGSRNISPAESTTYRALATGPGGSAEADVRLTVTAPAPSVLLPRPLSDAEFFQAHIQDIFFDFDKYQIREDAQRTLLVNARAFSERPSLTVLIEGHCDERGSEKYNLALGDRRANSAKQFLLSQGINESRLETMTYGEERPFAQGHNEGAWAQNRRAHFVLKGSSITDSTWNR